MDTTHMKNFFGRLMAKPVFSQMTPLETALLESLKKEPDLWKHAEGKTPHGDVFISLTHREKGVSVNSRWSFPYDAAVGKAWQRELQFTAAFAHDWHAIAEKIAKARDEKDRATRAEAVAAEMKKRMGVTT